MKLLIWAAVCGLVIWWLVRSGKPAARSESRELPQQTMLRCAHCGLHVPDSEALVDPAGAAFCSKDHLALHSRADS
jgi:uncharacterized protein